MKRILKARVLRRALIAAAVAVALPGTASAAQLVISPSQLIPYSTLQADIQTFVGVSGSASFWYPLRLPAGTVITGLEYEHGANPAAQTAVGILRVTTIPTPRMQGVWAAASDVETVTRYEFIDVAGGLVANASRRVRAGWDYFVYVLCESGEAMVGKIRVRY